MAETSAIAWTDSTFNPWIGCTKVGPGCDNCYAELLDRNRFSHTLGPWTGEFPRKQQRVIHWGRGAPRHRTAPTNWHQPIKWNREAEVAGVPRRVFCASLADVFDNEVPQEWRDDLFELITATPWLRWQLLTKRIANASVYRFPNNVWLGITVVTQAEVERDIPKLLAVNAGKRFLSCEPLLEAIDIAPFLDRGASADNGAREFEIVDWVICGGESGHAARPFNIEWARSLRDACQVGGVPFFMKQMGTMPVYDMRGDGGVRLMRIDLSDRAGANPAEWPKDLRVREFPA